MTLLVLEGSEIQEVIYLIKEMRTMSEFGIDNVLIDKADIKLAGEVLIWLYANDEPYVNVELVPANKVEKAIRKGKIKINGENYHIDEYLAPKDQDSLLCLQERVGDLPAYITEKSEFYKQALGL